MKPSAIYLRENVKEDKPFFLPERCKQHLRSNRLIDKIWTQYRCLQLRQNYRLRREYYNTVVSDQGLVYREENIVRNIRNRIKSRGYTPARKRMGEVHTFVCVPMHGWHEHLMPDMHELGAVTHFDYASFGFDVEEFQRVGRSAIRKRKEMLKMILPALREAHRKRPVDWVFCYGGGYDTSPALIQQITEEFGIPTVNISLDDKQSWDGYELDECRSGMIDITSAFDLFVTSAQVTCEWHMAEGGRPIYMPEGFNSACYHPLSVVQDIPVSFIGSSYGFRRSAIRFLRNNGIKVETFGPGWRTKSVWGEEQVKVINRSLINLGMGGIGYIEYLTNVKTRDFEIPGTGGGVYLTSFNPDLAQHFIVGKEILCYRNRDEILELIRYYLAHPEEAHQIAHKGRERCLREHRWLHRYQKMLRILGIFDEYQG